MQQKLAVASVLILAVLAGASVVMIETHAMTSAASTGSVQQSNTTSTTTVTTSSSYTNSSTTTTTGGSLLTGPPPNLCGGGGDDGTDGAHQSIPPNSTLPSGARSATTMSCDE